VYKEVVADFMAPITIKFGLLLAIWFYAKEPQINGVLKFKKSLFC